MLYRMPFVILAAVGIVSILNGVLALHPDVTALTRNYKDVTHPIWDNSFDLIFKFFGYRLSTTAKNYLIVGAIVLAMTILVKFGQHLWPRQSTISDGDGQAHDYFFIPMFSEVVVWTVVIIAFSQILTFVKPMN